MQTNLSVSQSVLISFLNRWPLSTIVDLTLEKYVGLKDKDTFCQWVEHRTKELGSIQGVSSIKFGIYKRGDPKKKPKLFSNDDLYSWQRGFGNTKFEAFQSIKTEVIEIIKASLIGEFERIDFLRLTNFFKWKIAYLYSNERLIPIFKPDILKEIAEYYGFKTDRNTPISKLQEFIISNKPVHLSIYEYADYLLSRFGTNRRGTNKTPHRKTTRKATNSFKTSGTQRNIVSSFIADYKHDRIQEALKLKLITLYGSDAVKKEENYVDIKLSLLRSITFYEIKTASFASDCIKQALGQVLSYVHHDTETKKKRIVVVGQFAPNKNDKEFIEYIQKTLDIDFDYEFIPLA